MDLHAKLSPSSSDRWSACPGSVALSAGYPDTPGEASALGTAFHSLCELLLREGTEPDPLVGCMMSAWNPELKTHGWDRPFDAEGAAWVRFCIDYVRFRAEELGVSPLLEQRVKVADDCWGTADVVLAQEFGVLEVIDFKFGWGEVLAADNTQLMLYALGAADEDAIYVEVKLTILQPKIDERLKSESYGPEALDEWRAWALDAIEATKAPDAPLVAGEKQCQWCPASASCPELRKEAEAAADVDFAAPVVVNQTLPVPAHDPVLLAQVLAKAPMVEAFVKACRGAAMGIIQAGGTIPGWKISQGKKNRAWKDPDKAAAALGRLGLKKDVRCPPTVLSPKQALDRLKAGSVGTKQLVAFAKRHIHVPDGGKLAIVPDDDKRPGIEFQGADEDFKMPETEPLGFLDG